MRRRVVGEDYVAESLEKSGGDFMRPLVQFATVSLIFCFCFAMFGENGEVIYGAQSHPPLLNFLLSFVLIFLHSFNAPPHSFLLNYKILFTHSHTLSFPFPLV